MPIKAASDKLIREMEMFGNDFENYGKEEEEVVQVSSHTFSICAAIDEADSARSIQITPTDEPGNATALATTSDTSPSSADPSKAKKGKLQAKSTGLQYQFQIMESIGTLLYLLSSQSHSTNFSRFPMKRCTSRRDQTIRRSLPLVEILPSNRSTRFEHFGISNRLEKEFHHYSRKPLL